MPHTNKKKAVAAVAAADKKAGITRLTLRVTDRTKRRFEYAKMRYALTQDQILNKALDALSDITPDEHPNPKI